MESDYFSKSMNNAYGLKLKDFKVKLDQANNETMDAAWIGATYTDKGVRIGWFAAFNHKKDDKFYHLLNDKGDWRVFKTTDAAIKFYSDIDIVTMANISWTFY